MGFNHLNRSRIDLEAVIYRTFQPFLGAPIWSNQTIRPAVLIDAASCNHSMDVVAICQSVAQALQYHHPDAFAGHETIGSRVKAVAFPLRRKHAGAIGDLVEPGSWL